MISNDVSIPVNNHYLLERIANTLDELLETNKEILRVLYSIKSTMPDDEEDEMYD